MTAERLDILLVEDDPNDVELTMHALRTKNLLNSIQVVRDGAEALDYLFRSGDFSDRPPNSDPKVILLDLKLPKVDGLQVLERIKADAGLRTVPVVMLTSSREERDIVASYGLGVNSYIVKPVDFEQFAAAIQTAGMYWLVLNRPPVLNSTSDRPSPAWEE